MSYDTKCFELAGEFLSDEKAVLRDDPKKREELAQIIQDAIEEYLDYEREK